MGSYSEGFCFEGGGQFPVVDPSPRRVNLLCHTLTDSHQAPRCLRLIRGQSASHLTHKLAPPGHLLCPRNSACIWPPKFQGPLQFWWYSGPFRKNTCPFSTYFASIYCKYFAVYWLKENERFGVIFKNIVIIHRQIYDVSSVANPHPTVQVPLHSVPRTRSWEQSWQIWLIPIFRWRTQGSARWIELLQII